MPRHTLSFRSTFAMLLVGVALLTTAHAQLTPGSDSYTNSANPTTNYGSKTLLDVNGATQITYIQFNLASIPAGTSISQATLKLYVNSVTTAGTFNLDYVNGAWSESTIDASNAPPLGSTIASGVNLTTADKNQYILIDVTSAVQAWLNGSETNNGIALLADATLDATFDSKESTSTSHPAELDIAYAGGTITGVTTASSGGLTGGGSSGALKLSLTTACGSGQILQWNGSAWNCATVTGAGTVTNVGTGLGLTGGPITASGTLSVDTTKVPLLAAANTFTGNQTVNGNLSATGVVTGSGFQVGSNLFDSGSFSSGNGFTGFAGYPGTTGTGNTASGVQALYGNGSNNSAFGYQSMFTGGGGGWNTGVGYQALYANTGTYNTATGAQALWSPSGGANVADGYWALLNDSSGSNNTAVGYYALLENTSGSSNTAVGSYAGFPDGIIAFHITGSNDTFLGAQTALGSASLTNATAIGANAEVDASNALILGSINGVNGASVNTNVGIGTTTPAHLLEVDANTAVAQIAMVGSATDAAISVNNTASGGREYWIDSGSGTAGVGAGNFAVWDATAGAARLVINQYGNVGIGTTSPNYSLTLANGLQAIAASWNTYSSRRWKTNIQPIHAALAKVERLRGVSYDLKDTGKHEVGVIAEEVGAVVPEVVTWENEGKDARGVDYGRLTALLIEATKEQQALIRRQQSEIRTQQAEIARLASQIKTIQAALKPAGKTDSEARAVKAHVSLARQ